MAVTLFFGLALIVIDIRVAWLVSGMIVAEFLGVRLLTPRRYEVFDDRVTIGFGGPLRFNIPISTIREARPISGWRDLARLNHRFATSKDNMVQIVRRHGWGVVISPSDRDLFLDRLNRILKRPDASGRIARIGRRQGQ